MVFFCSIFGVRLLVFLMGMFLSLVSWKHHGRVDIREESPASSTRDDSILSLARYKRPCSTAASRQWEYCDTSLSNKDRISFLMNALTPPEKISMLGNRVPAIPRLSLPEYNWWSEALHGVSSSCCPPIQFNSTSFPQVCTTGASFNKTLFEKIGNAIGTEAVQHYYALADVPGLTYWTPNVNLFRDPRWGRGQEVPGEDPYLNAAYATALIPALQYGDSSTSRKPRIAAACKHFAAYSIETGRMAFDAKVNLRDMEESFLPMFEACVKAGAMGFMCSYNAVNGVPSCANADLLTNKLRNEWGFDGYITGDCGAVENIYAAHNFTESMEEGVGAALRAGVDTDCGGAIQQSGMAALQNGTVTIEDVDRALRNLFRVQFRLGYYDPPASGTAGVEEAQVVGRRQLDHQVHMHNELALEAARQGIVLLKNSNAKLPLDENRYQSIALFGPNADATHTMQGNYYGKAPFLISPKQGLQDMGLNVTYYKGCNITTSHDDNALELVQANEICLAATTSDASVLVMGLDQSIESEGRDRTSLIFPGVGQHHLISLVTSCAKRNGDKPVVLVIMAGGPVDVSSYKDDDNVDAIFYVGYPGQAGGTAVAEALYGKFNPSGRLTTTIYPQEFADSVDLRDMRMRPSDKGFPGRTHRYYTGKVVYPFGYGLSYSSFRSSITSVRKEDATKIHVEVHNNGPMAGSQSILLFHSGPNAGKQGNPIKTLVGFEKIYLDIGQATRLAFEVDNVVMQEVGLHKFALGMNEDGEGLQVYELIVA